MEQRRRRQSPAPGFTMTGFQLFCIRWSVLFDTSSDRLSRTEMALRTLQVTTILISTAMTMTSVLVADNKKAFESFTYFIICLFMLANLWLAVRTKRFNRAMLLMLERELPAYDRPMPRWLRRRLADDRASCDGFTRRVIMSYLMLVVFEVPATASVPLAAAAFTDVRLGSQSTQMVSSYFPFDTSQPLVFAISFAVQFMIVVVVKFIITGIMCSFSFFVGQMIVQFRVLATYVEHAAEIVAYRATDDGDGDGGQPPERAGDDELPLLLAHIRDCVQMHDQLCRYREWLNESYGYVMLLELMFSTMYFCTSVFNVLFVGNPFVMVKGMLTLTNYLTEFFIFCMYGSMVEDTHDRLLQAAYGSAWYTRPVGFRRAIAMIMFRAQVPLQLKLSKVFVANLPLFLSVLKVSYSGVNALRAANADAN